MLYDDNSMDPFPQSTLYPILWYLPRFSEIQHLYKYKYIYIYMFLITASVVTHKLPFRYRHPSRSKRPVLCSAGIVCCPKYLSRQADRFNPWHVKETITLLVKSQQQPKQNIKARDTCKSKFNKLKAKHQTPWHVHKSSNTASYGLSMYHSTGRTYGCRTYFPERTVRTCRTYRTGKQRLRRKRTIVTNVQNAITAITCHKTTVHR